MKIQLSDKTKAYSQWFFKNVVDEEHEDHNDDSGTNDDDGTTTNKWSHG